MNEQYNKQHSAVTEYLSTIGAVGGRSGTGAAKRRSKKHYSVAGKASAEIRMQNRKAYVAANRPKFNK